MCVNFEDKYIFLRISFQKDSHVSKDTIKEYFFLFIVTIFIFTSTQVKKWTGNVPSLHIIGLDRPQMITTSTVTLHPKKQDAKEHCCVFSHVLSISSTRVVVYIISFPNQVLL